MRKKIFLFIFALFLLFVFGCNKNDVVNNTKTSTSNTTINDKNLNDFKEQARAYINNPNDSYNDVLELFDKLTDNEKNEINDLYQELVLSIQEYERIKDLESIEFNIDCVNEIYINEYSVLNIICDRDDIEFVINASNDNVDFLVRGKEVSIIGKSIGETEITVSIKDSNISKSVVINVLEEIKPVETIDFSIDYLSEIHVDDDFMLIIHCDNEDVEFEYSFSNNNLSYDINGREVTIFGDEVGETEITISIKDSDISKVVLITILEKIITPTKIYYESKTNLTIGEEFTVLYRVLPNNASQEIVLSCNNDCLEIDGYVIKANKIGECVLTIKCKDFDFSIDVNINVYGDDVNNDITLFSPVTREMTSPSYWLNKLDNSSDVILTLDEIKAVNENIFNTSKCKVVNILDYKETITKNELLSMINTYSVSSSYKINGAAQPSNYSSKMASLCNKDNISDVITIQYGLINKFCDLRSFPTNDVATTSNSFDRFQETGLEYGEGVLIFHTSSDGEWLFVQAYNYYGWVEKQFITIVSKEEMINYVNPEKFLIVTAQELVVNDTIYRMSTKFPYEKIIGGYYYCPFVSDKGIESIMIPVESDVNVGYLPYTTDNVLRQAFKMLGNVYSWGDDNIHGHDCSSTMAAI